MSITRDARAIAPNAVPSPSSAVTIGSPIATNEPKAISSTTIAAARPTAPAAPKETSWTCSIAAPPSSTCREGARACSAPEMTRSTVGFESSGASLSNVTVANAIRPSPEIARPPPAAYGLVTVDT